MMTQNVIRSWQDSNLRSHRESDFESDALTSRPQLLMSAWSFSHQVIKLGVQKLSNHILQSSQNELINQNITVHNEWKIVTGRQ